MSDLLRLFSLPEAWFVCLFAFLFCFFSVSGFKRFWCLRDTGCKIDLRRCVGLYLFWFCIHGAGADRYSWLVFCFCGVCSFQKRKDEDRPDNFCQ